MRKTKILSQRGYLSDEEFYSILRSSKQNSAGLLSAGYQNFFFAEIEKDAIKRMWLASFGDQIEEILRKAKDICNHRFEILGFGTIDTGPHINWNKEYLQEIEWPSEYYLDIDVIGVGQSTDVKVTWEINRFHHLWHLGIAHLLTDEGRFLDEFVGQVSHWIDSNPAGSGVNWTCAMEAAIRAINWLWGFLFFCHSKKIVERFCDQLVKSLWEHGRFIFDNLEFGKNSGNHLLCDALGLLYLGIFFRDFPEGEKWYRRGKNILFRELRRQIYEDGVHFERSPGYHGLVLEIFLHAACLLKVNNISIPSSVLETLEKMLHFTAACTKPDGSFPRFGDCDDGCVVAFDGQVRSLDPHAEAFSTVRNIPGAGSSHHYQTGFWLSTGISESEKEQPKALDRSSMVQSDIICSNIYPHGGFAFLRHSEYFLALNLGDIKNRGPGSHTHHDLMSFELSIGNDNFIVDSGTYLYTSSEKWRNFFRGNAAHNALSISNADSYAPVDFGQPFPITVSDKYKACVRKWLTGDSFDYIDAEHYLFDPFTHRRTIFFDKCSQGWVIEDELVGPGEEHSCVSFHFHPQYSTRMFEDRRANIIVVEGGAGLNLAIVLLSDRTKSTEESVAIYDSWYSPVYGKKERNSKVVMGSSGCCPHRYTVVIVPFSGQFEVACENVISRSNLFIDRFQAVREKGEHETGFLPKR